VQEDGSQLAIPGSFDRLDNNEHISAELMMDHCELTHWAQDSISRNPCSLFELRISSARDTLGIRHAGSSAPISYVT
jgi:hypothetical protein